MHFFISKTMMNSKETTLKPSNTFQNKHQKKTLFFSIIHKYSISINKHSSSKNKHTAFLIPFPSLKKKKKHTPKKEFPHLTHILFSNKQEIISSRKTTMKQK